VFYTKLTHFVPLTDESAQEFLYGEIPFP